MTNTSKRYRVAKPMMISEDGDACILEVGAEITVPNFVASLDEKLAGTSHHASGDCPCEVLVADLLERCQVVSDDQRAELRREVVGLVIGRLRDAARATDNFLAEGILADVTDFEACRARLGSARCNLRRPESGPVYRAICAVEAAVAMVECWTTACEAHLLDWARAMLDRSRMECDEAIRIAAVLAASGGKGTQPR